MGFKYLGIWNRIFLANKQAAQLGCSAGSIARYVTGAAARLDCMDAGVRATQEQLPGAAWRLSQKYMISCDRVLKYQDTRNRICKLLNPTNSG